MAIDTLADEQDEISKSWGKESSQSPAVCGAAWMDTQLHGMPASGENNWLLSSVAAMRYPAGIKPCHHT